jgi:hypothetical protein
MKEEEYKYTPGPWTISGSHIIGYPESNIAIAVIYSNVGQPAKANTKLISAAPDMFEALQSVNNYFIDLQNKCALTNSDERAWKLVAKAIKKATE